ncbi:amino acid ABC transporter substrate-binding protein [Weizmannia acidilactici]|uniref:Amino acid ABC transporter substrate-binding protein n=1 Tax=Weizmannia acidilactici TaxID=2607726 RepID=A0A5J4JJD1_9BACI|nr:amino acid ABC transporter substrate-binding protein [Weizmannia acidilactici]GER68283.1 amino acid ABC transporter substrate-binding protein [Weizmannia acidilactici]GER71339.1 amino acid ABC transporter substrate-binding protein [Weizmannia acidilactici]GER72553.1 amino acid ABC transporter substrate-binding protein [Weizmannia acidilactici]
MKRFVSVMIIIAAVLSVMAGCSSGKSPEKKNDTLVIGIDDKFAPMGFRDKNNNIVGFDIDMAKAAAKKMGKKVKFQPIDWSTKEQELNSGRIDLIWNGYTITPERKKKVLFTKPYLKNSQVVVTLADSKITKLSDLQGKVVGLQSLSSAADALDANPIKSKIKKVTEYSDNVQALNDLKTGRLDAVVIDEVVINYYMTKEKNTFKVLKESLAPEKYGVGVKKGNTELLKELQKAMDEMNKDGTSAKISKKWFGANKVLD